MNAIKHFDHNGNGFNSIKAMCAYWGVPYQTFFERRKQGWTLEKILTTPTSVANKENKPEIKNTEFKWNFPRV
jgi:hypothetical protein